MGIFAEHAQEFFEYGLQPIPVFPLKKACYEKGYDSVFYDQKLTQEVLDKWIESHGSWDIAIVCGKHSGVIGIDFDYVGFEDSETLENNLLGFLPETPAIKKGKKGWTRFYKYSEAFSNTRSFKRFVPALNKDVTFVDLLSNRRITVMPPSGHSKGIDYEWIGTQHLFDCLEDLPELTTEDIKHIEDLCALPFGDFFSKDKESRHDKVFGRIMRASNEVSDIEELVERVLAFDRMANSQDKKGPYFEDKKNTGKDSPRVACRNMCERVIDWKKKMLLGKGVLWEVGKATTSYWQNVGTDEKPKYKPSANHADFVEFFHAIYPSARKDYFTGVVFHRDNLSKQWSPIENEIGVVRSKAHEVGLDRGLVQDALHRWYETLEPRPLFELNPWDGKDHIAEMVRHITWEDMDHEVAVDLFKDWLAGVFRRMRNPEDANRMIIVRGEQGIGKDRWINHLLGALGHNHGTISLDPRRKVENFIALDGLLTGFIPEFDETVEVPIAMLKTLITSKSAVYRRPYDRIAINSPLRYSLISSVNFEDILRDPTGNRRFIIMDAVKIDWGYSKTVSQQKILDQANFLAESGYYAGEVALAAVKAKLEEEAPVDTEEMFMQEVAELIKSKRDSIGTIPGKEKKTQTERRIEADAYKIRWSMIAEEVEKIAKKYGFRTNRCQKVIKRYGFSKKDRVSMYYELPDSYAHDGILSKKAVMRH